MSETKKNKYNRIGSGANQSVFGTIVSDTGTQNNVNTEKKKKKATFEMDADLHRNLRRFAAEHDTTMITIVEKALNEYFDKN